MKSLLLCFILLSGTFALAQDSRLFDNDWHLTGLIKNGVSYPPPNGNGLLSFIPSAPIQVHFCNNMMATIAYDTTPTAFTLSEYSPCLCFCNSPVLDAYDNTYFSFFMNQEPTNNFTYSITEANEIKTLTVNSMYNEQAIYSSVFLANETIKITDFSVYPNPATEFMTINSSSKSNSGKLEIYDVFGKLSQQMPFSSESNRISIADLSPGLYFVVLKTDSGSVTKKLLKL